MKQKKPYANVAIPHSYHLLLTELAEREHRSIGGQACHIIDLYLKRQITIEETVKKELEPCDD